MHGIKQVLQNLITFSNIYPGVNVLYGLKVLKPDFQLLSPQKKVDHYEEKWNFYQFIQAQNTFLNCAYRLDTHKWSYKAYKMHTPLQNDFTRNQKHGEND